MMEKPTFDSVLHAVLTVTAMLFVVDLTMALVLEMPSEAQVDLLTAVRSAWQMGFSALVGLMGGKALV